MAAAVGSSWGDANALVRRILGAAALMAVPLFPNPRAAPGGQLLCQAGK